MRVKGKATVRPDPQSPYCTHAEAAALLNISVRSMDRLVKRKDGPPVCRIFKRKKLYRREDLDAWVKAQSESKSRKRSKPSNPNGAVPAPPAS